MQEEQLRPEQAAAAHELKKHISVSAGPGSGKTKVLVERYLHILRQQKLSIDQIVAITFTNRAANEMRERLRTRLNQMLQTTEGAERRHWLGYKRTLDGAVITTIHGFCARLLREFPIEASVDPQFVLLDEHRTAMLVESVVEEVLSEFISHGHVEVSRLTLGVGRARLAAALAQLYQDARGQGLSFAELARKTAESHSTDNDYSAALAELDERVGRLLNWPKLSIKAAAKRDSFANSWWQLRKGLEKIPGHQSLKDYCLIVEQLRAHRPTKTAVGDLSAELDNLLWGTSKTNEYSGLLPRICFDSFARVYALEMINLLSRIHDRLNEEKHKMSALDFDDLEGRTLDLLQMPEVITRAEERYKFFLVDEFQDTNAQQRQLLERLALSKRRDSANLFIVGDRKQSIYGFRGADVDVFREMTATLIAAGGEEKPLRLNFRSQPQLIGFFNHLFERLFQVPEDTSPEELRNLDELGYVEHESSEPQREVTETGPLVELMVTTRPASTDSKGEQELRLLDAQQIAGKINSLIQVIEGLKYSDIALLFRAMTQVHIYESTFRRASIPYQTVLGRGFYEREEITDLIQLLRFLDNKTDELALAAVLRSPLCGISDNALLALRCAPRNDALADADPLRGSTITRPLYRALRQHQEIAFISADEHQLLDRAAHLIRRLISRRHHFSIEDLLRFAVDESEYMTVVAANFDGAQRLANVQRLFTLAARFERSGTHLIRDFVRYVEEFEAIGSRESEGQIDQAANAVRLMTIHQAKGLEFPVVIIPDLHRLSRVASDVPFLLDRHHGLTLKVPDGRGKLVPGRTFSRFETRNELREQFESMRLLYVAATRAQDRLILSGATEKLANLSGRNDSWLKWIWQALELRDRTHSDVVTLSEGVELQLTLTPGEELGIAANKPAESIQEDVTISGESITATFPLLEPVDPDREQGVHRLSVTQLINYQRCPRQYYFDRVLRLPSADEMAVWNNAEAPEPPANLTATLKGAVIHRFCELYNGDQTPEDCLRRSFAEVVRSRQAELADRLMEINHEAALQDLLPLAQNYLASDVFRRVELAREFSDANNSGYPSDGVGLWSELSFRLRRPLGVISGVIDKLLITRRHNGSLEVEIIDFKTNRILAPRASRLHSGVEIQSRGNARNRSTSSSTQFAFDFDRASDNLTATAVALIDPPPSFDDVLRVAAKDYQLQMQSYALAVRELLPAMTEAGISVTLHFLEPNVEFHLADDLLATPICEQVIDEAILKIISASEPTHFPVKPATHCRMCNFLRVCASGREWVNNSRQEQAAGAGGRSRRQGDNE
jgi:ATP-dependent helicase/nuclease subunit A